LICSEQRLKQQTDALLAAPFDEYMSVGGDYTQHDSL